MYRVKNKRAIRRIADRTRRVQKGKNIIAVLAIALTALMFTSVFTVGGSLIEKAQESTMRQVGTRAHGEFKFLTEQEYDIVKKDKKLKEVSCRIVVGTLGGDELKKLPTEVYYFEENNARSGFCYPEEGHLPQRENEISTSDLVLKALGVPCRLGETVPLEIHIGKKTEKREFILSGFYKGDPVMPAQMVAVSKEFQEKVAPVPGDSVLYGGILDEDGYTGRIMADISFHTSLMLKKQMDALGRRCGFGETKNIGINWAYLGQDMDADSFWWVLLLLAMILVSGYLIIYNIFYIHVIKDISYYGLLKTIGTTGRQLRRIVHRQANVLSLYGIPLGLLGGAFVGKWVLPKIMNSFVYAETVDQKVTLDWWVFAGAALFSFVTVYISCIKPCRLAAKVTAIEAVRYTEGQTGKSGKKKSRHFRLKRKKTKKVSPRTMAVQNVWRNRKRVFVVVASLSLALVLLNCVYSILSGFDMDKYIAQLAISDFSVSGATLDNMASSEHDTEGVTEEFLNEVKQQEGITELGNVYVQDIAPTLEGEDWERVEERIFNNPRAREILEMYAPPDMPDYVQTMQQDHIADGKTYGISKMVMEILEHVEGNLDWEKFQSGDYVITTRMSSDEDTAFFHPGEKITIYNEQGESRQYEVMAVADIPYACGMKIFGIMNCDYILPENEFLDFMGKRQPMRTIFNVNPDQEEQVEKWVAGYCGQVDPDLAYVSKETIRKEFDSFKNVIEVVGNLLCVILAFIGILNFINTMFTSVLSRKTEFAMMEAVGMTGAQLRRMLCLEGGYYAFLTAAVSILLSTVFSVTALRSMETFFFTWKFTLLPILICVPVLFFIVLLVPALCHKTMRRSSVVERLKRTES